MASRPSSDINDVLAFIEKKERRQQGSSIISGMGRAKGGADQLLYGDEIRESPYKNYTEIDQAAFEWLDKIYDHHMYDIPKDDFSEDDDEALLIHQIDLEAAGTPECITLTLNIYPAEDRSQFTLQASLHVVGSQYSHDTFWQGGSFGAGLDACRRKGEQIIAELRLRPQDPFPISDEQALEELQELVRQNAVELQAQEEEQDG